MCTERKRNHCPGKDFSAQEFVPMNHSNLLIF